MRADPASEVRKLKQESGPALATLGSGSIVSQLTQAGLIDEYQIVVHPVIIGQGKALFPGVKDMKTLALKKTRAFKNGNVLLSYEPAS
jgi:dihydrofolate reductase